MEAKDLRIGNLVTNCINGEVEEIYSLNNCYVNNFEIQNLICSHKPIPLTEEWLLKFGLDCYPFGSYKEWGFSIGKYSCCPLISNKSGKYKMLLGVGNEIKYVHQLQNLYYFLTGDELKTK